MHAYPAIALLLLSACANTIRLADRLEANCGFRETFDASAIDLAKLPGGPRYHPNALPLLQISEGEFLFDWQPFAPGVGTTGLEKRMRRVIDEVRGEAREPSREQVEADDASPQLMVAIAADHAYAEVRPLLAAAQRAGFEQVHFLGISSEPGATPEPPDPELYYRLRGSDDVAMRQMTAAQAFDEAITYCPDISGAFSAVANAAPSQKCLFLATGVRESSSFPCWIDADVIATAMMAVSVPMVWTTFHTVNLDTGPGNPGISNDASWASALKVLSQGDRLGVAAPD